jgi:hypothetical protein
VTRRWDVDEESWASGAARIYSSAMRLNESEFITILVIAMNEKGSDGSSTVFIWVWKGREEKRRGEMISTNENWSSLLFSSLLSSSAGQNSDQLFVFNSLLFCLRNASAVQKEEYFSLQDRNQNPDRFSYGELVFDEFEIYGKCLWWS